MRNSKNDKHITLKEAAELSGYSPDYLGQLIRNGKLKGEQVFLNTAWMTTEEAVLEYVGKTKKGNCGSKEPFSQQFFTLVKKRWEIWYRNFLYGILAINIIFILFLFYIFSVSIEKHFEKQDIERLSPSETITREMQ